MLRQHNSVPLIHNNFFMLVFYCFLNSLNTKEHIWKKVFVFIFFKNVACKTKAKFVNKENVTVVKITST